ncbi:MAG: flagellar motor protein MotB [Alphaproteobacteria bacterium]|nr:flagellar motor protein MotB [Alphaproteobacteria bacterium]
MLRRKRRKIEQAGGGSNTGQMMNLSLFIMLLAFFIVLNSLSSYEEIKTEKVKRSIELAFAKDARQDDYSPSVREDPVKSVNQGDTFERLEALFESQIASYEVVKSKSRGVMMVTLPYEQFKRAVMAVGQKDLTQYPSRRAIAGNFFLPTLVSLMRANIDGAPTRMEILLHAPENPAQTQNRAPDKMAALINQVGTFSRRLEKQGIPQKMLNIGVSRGDPETVDLVFRKYVPFSPVEVTAP